MSLARHIRLYWAKRGRIVKTMVEPTPHASKHAKVVWSVRSDLVCEFKDEERAT